MNKLSFFSTLLTLCACGSLEEQQTPQHFQDERAAAVHFLQPMFDTLDCEGVGIVESGEVDEHFYGVFGFADVDNSRSLSKQEYIKSIHNADPGLESFIFASIDKNGDGMLSPLEFRNHVIMAIDIADTNRNGELTETEAEMQNWRKPIQK